jgi:hypothetical protein
MARIWSPSTTSPAYGLGESGQVGRPAPDVDVGAVGLIADRRHVGAQAGERLRRDPRVRAVRAVDDDAQPVELAAEALEHVLQVALRGDAHAVDRAAARAVGGEQRFDLLLGGVHELLPVTVEELDAVVLGRVVRGGDHDAEVEREQRNGRSGEHTCQHGVSAGRHDAPRERLLELFSRRARIPADEHASAPAPERRRLAELLDELRGEVRAHDAAHAVGAEVAAHVAG